MNIKNFNDFVNKDILYIFDMDETIVSAPDFSKMSIEFLKENNIIEDILLDSVKIIGVNLKDLKWEDGRIYVYDPNQLLRCQGNWVRKGQRIYLVAPKSFYGSDVSMPTGLKELSELYKSVENKCIVTARWDSARPKIVKKLNELGLELPKYGLHMAPDYTRNSGEWKGHQIVKILKETGFKKAKFYDDNSKYLRRASKVVRTEMPNVIWEPIKVI
jgi:hypothetical protein